MWKDTCQITLAGLGIEHSMGKKKNKRTSKTVKKITNKPWKRKALLNSTHGKRSFF